MPQDYRPNENCIYEVMLPVGMGIELKFYKFSIEYSYDYILVHIHTLK